MSARLPLAPSQGLMVPEGPVLVMRPVPGSDLSIYDPAQLQVFHSDKAAFDQWVAADVRCTDGAGRFDQVVVILPRSKALAQDMIARAVAQCDGLVVIDGARTDGIDSIYKACRARGDVGGTVTKAHGRLFWMTATPENFTDWVAQPKIVAGDWMTTAGVFSADGIDPASAALAAALPPKLSGRCVDLGAGWGYLSKSILACEAVTHLDVVESEDLALACARHNIKDPRAAFQWADALAFSPKSPADAVIMNPPFHASRKGDPGIGQAFIQQAARILSPRGHLYMVANRHLPYEETLNVAFRDVRELEGPPKFKLFQASRPKR